VWGELTMASAGLTAQTLDEVKELEKRFRNQGYHPFHKQRNGTWIVYRGRLGYAVLSDTERIR
jgi:hypothetical protein